MLWEDVLNQLQNISVNVSSESKRVLKKRVPKTEAVRHEVRDNLFVNFNKFVKIVRTVYSSLDQEQSKLIKKLFTSLRDKVIRSYQVLKCPYKVPTSCVEYIDAKILDDNFQESEDGQESSDSENSSTDVQETEDTKIKLDIMAMSKMDFFNFVSRVLPNEFDGSSDKLQPMLDALNLIQANIDNHENDAVAYIKTRLTGRARDLISETDTLANIIHKLKTEIKTEDSQTVMTKLLSHKQLNKDANKYATEIEELANRLRRAYIKEGVPVPLAETYTANSTVRSLKTNTNSEKIKLVMEAGTFKSSQEAVTKFVSISADDSKSNTVFYARNGNQRGRYINNFRGRNHTRAKYQQNQNFRNNPRTQNYFHGNVEQNYRGRGYNRQGQRGRYTRYVRQYAAEDNQGNFQGSQQGPHREL